MIHPQGRLVSVAHVRDFVECEGEPGTSCGICRQQIADEVRPCHPSGMKIHGVFASAEYYSVGAEIRIDSLQGYEAARLDCNGDLMRTADRLMIESVMLSDEAGECLYSFGPKVVMEMSDE